MYFILAVVLFMEKAVCPGFGDSGYRKRKSVDDCYQRCANRSAFMFGRRDSTRCYSQNTGCQCICAEKGCLEVGNNRYHIKYDIYEIKTSKYSMLQQSQHYLQHTLISRILDMIKVQRKVN